MRDLKFIIVRGALTLFLFTVLFAGLGEAKTLRENEDVKEFYLGVAEGKRKSFRDVKHYKRRKRWLA